MLQSLNEMRKSLLHAVDGELGKVKDFLFDDHQWAIRYMVVDTGRFLPGRLVLLSPQSVKGAAAGGPIDVSLTKKQIEESPPLEDDKPVSRQHEDDLVRHFGWPVYWEPYPMGIPPVVGVARVSDAATEEAERSTPAGDPTLRSIREVSGYHIQARDDSIGHVDDFLRDHDSWAIRYLVLDTRNWLPGRKVLISPYWVTEVNWRESRVHVDLTRDQIKNSPEYDSDSQITQEYEQTLHDHYGRPVYW